MGSNFLNIILYNINYKYSIFENPFWQKKTTPKEPQYRNYTNIEITLLKRIQTIIFTF